MFNISYQNHNIYKNFLLKKNNQSSTAVETNNKNNNNNNNNNSNSKNINNNNNNNNNDNLNNFYYCFPFLNIEYDTNIELFIINKNFSNFEINIPNIIICGDFFFIYFLYLYIFRIYNKFQIYTNNYGLDFNQNTLENYDESSNSIDLNENKKNNNENDKLLLNIEEKKEYNLLLFDKVTININHIVMNTNDSIFTNNNLNDENIALQISKINFEYKNKELNFTTNEILLGSIYNKNFFKFVTYQSNLIFNSYIFNVFDIKKTIDYKDIIRKKVVIPLKSIIIEITKKDIDNFFFILNKSKMFKKFHPVFENNENNNNDNNNNNNYVNDDNRKNSIVSDSPKLKKLFLKGNENQFNINEKKVDEENINKLDDLLNYEKEIKNFVLFSIEKIIVYIKLNNNDDKNKNILSKDENEFKRIIMIYNNVNIIHMNSDKDNNLLVTLDSITIFNKHKKIIKLIETYNENYYNNNNNKINSNRNRFKKKKFDYENDNYYNYEKNEKLKKKIKTLLDIYLNQFDMENFNLNLQNVCLFYTKFQNSKFLFFILPNLSICYDNSLTKKIQDFLSFEKNPKFIFFNECFEEQYENLLVNFQEKYIQINTSNNLKHIYLKNSYKFYFYNYINRLEVNFIESRKIFLKLILKYINLEINKDFVTFNSILKSITDEREISRHQKVFLTKKTGAKQLELIIKINTFDKKIIIQLNKAKLNFLMRIINDITEYFWRILFKDIISKINYNDLFSENILQHINDCLQKENQTENHLFNHKKENSDSSSKNNNNQRNSVASNLSKKNVRRKTVIKNNKKNSSNSLIFDSDFFNNLNHYNSNANIINFNNNKDNSFYQIEKFERRKKKRHQSQIEKKEKLKETFIKKQQNKKYTFTIIAKDSEINLCINSLKPCEITAYFNELEFSSFVPGNIEKDNIAYFNQFKSSCGIMSLKNSFNLNKLSFIVNVKELRVKKLIEKYITNKTVKQLDIINFYLKQNDNNNNKDDNVNKDDANNEEEINTNVKKNVSNNSMQNNILNKNNLPNLTVLIESIDFDKILSTFKIAVIMRNLKIKFFTDTYEDFNRFVFENFRESQNILSLLSKSSTNYFNSQDYSQIQFDQRKFLISQDIAILNEDCNIAIFNYPSKCISHRQERKIPKQHKSFAETDCEFVNKYPNLELDKLCEMKSKNLYVLMRFLKDNTKTFYISMNEFNINLNRNLLAFSQYPDLKLVCVNNEKNKYENCFKMDLILGKNIPTKYDVKMYNLKFNYYPLPWTALWRFFTKYFFYFKNRTIINILHEDSFNFLKDIDLNLKDSLLIFKSYYSDNSQQQINNMNYDIKIKFDLIYKLLNKGNSVTGPFENFNKYIFSIKNGFLYSILNNQIVGKSQFLDKVKIIIDIFSKTKEQFKNDKRSYFLFMKYGNNDKLSFLTLDNKKLSNDVNVKRDNPQNYRNFIAKYKFKEEIEIGGNNFYNEFQNNINNDNNYQENDENINEFNINTNNDNKLLEIKKDNFEIKEENEEYEKSNSKENYNNDNVINTNTQNKKFIPKLHLMNKNNKILNNKQILTDEQINLNMNNDSSKDVIKNSPLRFNSLQRNSMNSLNNINIISSLRETDKLYLSLNYTQISHIIEIFQKMFKNQNENIKYILHSPNISTKLNEIQYKISYAFYISNIEIRICDAEFNAQLFQILISKFMFVYTNSPDNKILNKGLKNLMKKYTYFSNNNNNENEENNNNIKKNENFEEDFNSELLVKFLLKINYHNSNQVKKLKKLKLNNISLSNNSSEKNYEEMTDNSIYINNENTQNQNSTINNKNSKESEIKIINENFTNNNNNTKENFWEPFIEPLPGKFTYLTSKDNQYIKFDILSLIPIYGGIRNICRQSKFHSLNINVNERLMENINSLMKDLDKTQELKKKKNGLNKKKILKIVNLTEFLMEVNEKNDNYKKINKNFQNENDDENIQNDDYLDSSSNDFNNYSNNDNIIQRKFIYEYKIDKKINTKDEIEVCFHNNNYSNINTNNNINNTNEKNFSLYKKESIRNWNSYNIERPSKYFYIQKTSNKNVVYNNDSINSKTNEEKEELKKNFDNKASILLKDEHFLVCEVEIDSKNSRKLVTFRSNQGIKNELDFPVKIKFVLKEKSKNGEIKIILKPGKYFYIPPSYLDNIKEILIKPTFFESYNLIKFGNEVYPFSDNSQKLYNNEDEIYIAHCQIKELKTIEKYKQKEPVNDHIIFCIFKKYQHIGSEFLSNKIKEKIEFIKSYQKYNFQINDFDTSQIISDITYVLTPIMRFYNNLPRELSIEKKIPEDYHNKNLSYNTNVEDKKNIFDVENYIHESNKLYLKNINNKNTFSNNTSSNNINSDENNNNNNIKFCIQENYQSIDDCNYEIYKYKNKNMNNNNYSYHIETKIRPGDFMSIYEPFILTEKGQNFCHFKIRVTGNNINYKNKKKSVKFKDKINNSCCSKFKNKFCCCCCKDENNINNKKSNISNNNNNNSLNSLNKNNKNENDNNNSDSEKDENKLIVFDLRPFFFSSLTKLFKKTQNNNLILFPKIIKKNTINLPSKKKNYFIYSIEINENHVFNSYFYCPFLFLNCSDMNLEIRYGELKKTLACKSHCYDRYKKYEEKMLENSNKISEEENINFNNTENEINENEEIEDENIKKPKKNINNNASFNNNSFNMVDMDRVVMFNPSLNNHFIFEIGGVSLPDKDEKGNEIPFQEIESRWKKIPIIDISKYGGVNVDLTEKKGIISNFFSYNGLIKSKNNEIVNNNSNPVDNSLVSKENFNNTNNATIENEETNNNIRRSQKMNTIQTSNFNFNESQKIDKRKISEITFKKKKHRHIHQKKTKKFDQKLTFSLQMKLLPKSTLIFITASIYLYNQTQKDIYIYYLPMDKKYGITSTIAKAMNKSKFHYKVNYYPYVQLSYEDKHNINDRINFSGLINFSLDEIKNKEINVSLGNPSKEPLLVIKIVEENGFKFVLFTQKESVTDYPFVIINKLNKPVEFKQKDYNSNDKKKTNNNNEIINIYNKLEKDFGIEKKIVPHRLKEFNEYSKNLTNKNSNKDYKNTVKDTTSSHLNLNNSNNNHKMYYTWEEPLLYDKEKNTNLLEIKVFGSKFEINPHEIQRDIHFNERVVNINKTNYLDNIIDFSISKGKIRLTDKNNEFQYELYKHALVLKSTKEGELPIIFEFHNKDLKFERKYNGNFSMKIGLKEWEMFCVNLEETNNLVEKMILFFKKAKEFTNNFVIKKFVKKKCVYVEISEKKKEIKNDLDTQNIKVNMFLNIENISISFIMNHQEFMYIWFKNIYTFVQKSNNGDNTILFKKIIFKIKDYQIDNYANRLYYPIILAPLSDKLYDKNFFNFSLIINNFQINSGDLYQCDLIYINMSPIDLKFDNKFLENIHSFSKRLLFESFDYRAIQASKTLRDYVKELDNLDFFGINDLITSESRIHVKQFCIDDMKVCFSLKFDNIDLFLETSTFYFLKPVIEELGLRILSLDSVIFSFPSYIKINIYQSTKTFTKTIFGFLFQQFIGELIRALGGINSMAGLQLVENLNNNILNNMKNNTHSIQQYRNKKSFKDLYQVSMECSSSLIGGLFLLAYKMMATVGRIIATITLDKMYKKQRANLMNKSIKNLRNGLTLSIKLLLCAIFYIFSQVYYIPKEYCLRFHFIIGILISLFLIALGLILKPVCGIFDMITKSLEAIGTTINDVLADRVKIYARFPRIISKANLKDYNSIEALATFAKNCIDKAHSKAKTEEICLVMPGSIKKKKILVLFWLDRLMLVDYIGELKFKEIFLIHLNQFNLYGDYGINKIEKKEDYIFFHKEEKENKTERFIEIYCKKKNYCGLYKKHLYIKLNNIDNSCYIAMNYDVYVKKILENDKILKEKLLKE